MSESLIVILGLKDAGVNKQVKVFVKGKKITEQEYELIL